MHNDSVSRSNPNRDSASTQRPSHKALSKTDTTREREDVPRFRKLMEQRSGKLGDDHDIGATEATPAKKDTEGGKGFRQMMEKQQGTVDSGLFAPVARHQGGRGDGDGGDGDSASGDRDGNHATGGGQQLMDAPLGMQLQQQNQVVLQQASQSPPMAAASIAPALAELIERHVKQLLVPVSETQSAAQSREIMLTLKGDVLPGTQLWLSRTDKGWRLRADAYSAASYRQMVENAPQLIERFGKARLGELEVDPTLLG